MNSYGVLVGISHQRKRGKFGVNPALSRNCEKVKTELIAVLPLSQDARRVPVSGNCFREFHSLCSNLRGTDYGCLKF